MEPAMFSVANMFDAESGDDENNDFVERDHSFPGLVLRIREFAFHEVNANLVWPGASSFAEWIVEHKELFKGRRVLELGSGTGALAVFLKKTLELDITTSDYNDAEIEDNIMINCQLNGLKTLPHIRHTWGEDFPFANPDWDLIIASDILLYVNQYANLINTLSFLLNTYNLEIVKIASQSSVPIEPCTAELQEDEKAPFSGQELRRIEPISATSAGAVYQSLPDLSHLTVDCQRLGSESSTTSSLSLPFSDRYEFLDAHQPGAGMEVPNKGRKWAVARASFLPRPCFLMSWRRRIPKEDEALFFEGCRSAGFNVIDFGSRIYCIHKLVDNLPSKGRKTV